MNSKSSIPFNGGDSPVFIDLGNGGMEVTVESRTDRCRIERFPGGRLREGLGGHDLRNQVGPSSD